MIRHEYLPKTSRQNDDSELNEEKENSGGNNVFTTDCGD